VNSDELTALVVRTLAEYLATQGKVVPLLGPDTRLVGRDAVLDSMGLVNVVLDLESALLDAGVTVSLTSERAMSQRSSPFRTVATLVAFVLEGSGDAS
jgi:acyl carrier protein